MNNTGVQSPFGCIQNMLGSDGLCSAVPAYDLLLIIRVKVLDFPNFLSLGQLRNGPGAGYIHQLFAFRVCLHCSNDVVCSVHIDSHQFFTVLRVYRYQTGTVNADGLRIVRHIEKVLTIFLAAQVPLELLNSFRNVFGGGVTLEDKGTDMISAFEELLANVAAKETGCTGQKICGLFAAHNA